jgi:hypothetical protein
MAIGSWDPSATTLDGKDDIPQDWLQACVEWSRSDRLDSLDQFVDAAAQQRYAPVMQLEPEAWLQAVKDMDNDALLHLLRFFTVAEKLPGWSSGHRSPVIVLAKLLRKRGEKLTRETLQWIRAQSDNRFLPYGPL